MSRHRNIRNLDESDYYDYDDDYDDYDDESNYSKPKATASVTTKKGKTQLPNSKVNVKSNVNVPKPVNVSAAKSSKGSTPSLTKTSNVSSIPKQTLSTLSSVSTISIGNNEAHNNKTTTQESQDISGMGLTVDNLKLNEVQQHHEFEINIPDIDTPSRSRSSSFVRCASSNSNRSRSNSIDPYFISDDEPDNISQQLPSPNPHRPHLTMVVAGHVDAGKSTIVGSLLLKLGVVSKQTIHKYEKESRLAGKSSFYMAWVMDEDPSEREHGVTIDVAERHIRTEHLDFTALDTPGHRDFIPNMITGAAQADVALFVIPASVGEFESCMRPGAQTREHAVLLKALGVSQILVVINKLDLADPPWSESRYQLIQTSISNLLVELQFPLKNIRFVPLSGLSGENMIDVSPTCILNQWYTGMTLVQSIDTFREPPRQKDKNMRCVITGIHNMSHHRGHEVHIRVLQGRVRRGRRVAISGLECIETVLKIKREEFNYNATTSSTSTSSGNTAAAIIMEEVDRLEAGEEGVILLSDNHRKVSSTITIPSGTGTTTSSTCTEEKSISEGMVLCKGMPFPKAVLKFRATILTMSDMLPPIIPGASFELYLQGQEVECHVRKIYSMMTRVNGNTVPVKKPKCVPGGRSASVQIETVVTVYVEPFADCKALGRFALRAKGKTCAVGICDKVS